MKTETELVAETVAAALKALDKEDGEVEVHSGDNASHPNDTRRHLLA